MSDHIRKALAELVALHLDESPRQPGDDADAWDDAWAAARAALAQPHVQPEPVKLAADNFEWSSLYTTVSHMIARLGADGSIQADNATVDCVMDALHRLDAGNFVPGLAPRSALAEQPAPSGAVPEWIPVSERMPTAGVKVLVCYRNSYGRLRRTCAHYSPLHTVDASTWDEGEPDETEDGTFEPEGWWEEPVELELVEFISDEVTHWMPLPEAPTQQGEA